MWRTAPFFAISLGFGILALMTEPAGYVDLPVCERPFLAAGTTWFYVCKVLFPRDFCPLYPHWDVDPTAMQWWLLLIGAVATTAVVLSQRKRIGAHMLWGLACFIIGFLPAMGLLKFGYFRLSYVADHFLYLSMAGAACCIGVALEAPLTRMRGRARTAGYLLVCMYPALLAMETNVYAKVWNDSLTLWTRVIREDPDNWAARTYLGHAYLADNPSQAAIEFRKSLELRLSYADRFQRKAEACRSAHESYRADRFASRAAEITKGLPSAYYNVGIAMLRSNRPQEAMALFKEALRLEPDFVEALNNMGAALLITGSWDDAKAYLRKAIAVDPRNTDAQHNLNLILEEEQPPKARKEDPPKR